VQAIATPAPALHLQPPLMAGEPATCVAADATTLDTTLLATLSPDALLEVGVGGFEPQRRSLHPVVVIDAARSELRFTRPAVPGMELDAACGWAGTWTAPLPHTAQLDLRLVLDACCLELFAADGLASLTALVPPARGGLWLRLAAGQARVTLGQSTAEPA
jgi:hypothetical protein